MPVSDYLPEWQDLWEEAGHRSEAFFGMARDRGLMSQELYEHEMSMLVIPPEELEMSAEWEEVLRQQLKASIWTEPAKWFAQAWREFLKAFWAWIKETAVDFYELILKPIAAAAVTVWDKAEPVINEWGRDMYNYFEGLLMKHGPITPEDAPALGIKMLTLSLTAGIGAHFMSMGMELIHPFKQLGLTQMTGILAQLGSFGPVFAATVGVVQYGALRRPMQYAVNAVTRSQLPDDQLLQIMAVKPDIPMEKFVDTMKYHGYSDYWIDRIRATMYHEPRYFELKMMSEDESASEEWLWNKSRRAGFSEADTKIMVSSYVKGATRMQRLDYYKQAFYLFKEGLMDRVQFSELLDKLELRPDAKAFSARAAELAYLQDFLKDYVKYWTDSYLKDIISDDDLATHLSLLGMVPARVSLTVGLAKVRKRKRPAREDPPDLEPIMAKARTKYAQAYVTLYRKGLIDLVGLESYLVQLGIHPELAAATSALESARAATPIA